MGGLLNLEVQLPTGLIPVPVVQAVPLLGGESGPRARHRLCQEPADLLPLLGCEEQKFLIEVVTAPAFPAGHLLAGLVEYPDQTVLELHDLGNFARAPYASHFAHHSATCPLSTGAQNTVDLPMLRPPSRGSLA